MRVSLSLRRRPGKKRWPSPARWMGDSIFVVTDILLPHIDGLDLADHLAGLSSPPPILFISGVKVERTVPGPVLAKPFGPVAFLEQVGRMLTAVQQR